MEAIGILNPRSPDSPSSREDVLQKRVCVREGWGALMEAATAQIGLVRGGLAGRKPWLKHRATQIAFSMLCCPIGVSNFPRREMT